MKNIVKNVLLFIALYLIVCPLLFWLVNYLFDGEISLYTLAKSIGQGLGLAVARIIIWVVRFKERKKRKENTYG